MNSAKKLFRIIRHFKWLLLLSLILSAISVSLQLYIPILFGEAIDGIAAKGQVNFSYVAVMSRRILIFLCISASGSFLMQTVNNRLAFSTVQNLRNQAIRKLQSLPVSYIDSHRQGDLVQRVIADADQISDGLLLGFTQLFSGFVSIAVTIVFMFSKNLEITLVILLLTPLSFLVARLIAKKTYVMFRAQTRTRGEQTALINEMIGNQKIVKAFGFENRALERFDALNEELRGYNEKAIFFSALTHPATRCVNNIVYAIVALIGSFRVLAGALSVGSLAVLLSYASQYMRPFNDISSVLTELQNAFACADRLFELLEADDQSEDSKEVLEAGDGSVQFDHVSFSYTPQQPLITDFSFEAKPGQVIAIVGPTGCGKTTLINLLMRFYDVCSGTITIDRQDISSVSRASVRAGYGMVLQDTWLRSGTIRENICFGRPSASDEEIISAAKEAHSWDFIKRLPDQLDTIVDDDSLSQGQKQLLCITRVMLCHPPMLILDEATSSIDTRTELLIQQAFAKLMAGRTTFIVAHRLSTIIHADHILVMKNGQIIEQGTHKELLSKNGFYSELYHSQFSIVQSGL